MDVSLEDRGGTEDAYQHPRHAPDPTGEPGEKPGAISRAR